MSSISRRSTRRSQSLKRDRRLALHRGDEVVHEMVGGQIDDVAAGVGRAGRPGDGIEQMRFAEAHGRMDVDRVEAHRAVERGAARPAWRSPSAISLLAPGTKVSNVILGSSALPESASPLARPDRRACGLAVAGVGSVSGSARDLGRLRQPRTGLAVDAHGEMQPRDARALRP